jgi:hypothetical protein
MKKILLSVFCILSSCLVFSQTTIDTIRQDWYEGAWINVSKVTGNYVNGKATSSSSYTWNNYQWDITSQSTSTYDGNGNLKEILVQQWDYISNSFKNDSKTTYAYSNQTQLDSVLTVAWVNGVLVNANRITIKYIANQTYITGQYWNTNQNDWVNQYLDITTTDMNGNVIEIQHKEPDLVNNTFVHYQKTTSTYSANSLTSDSLEEYHEGNTPPWSNSYKATYTYDGNNKRKNDLISSWDYSYDTWEPTTQINYAWNIDGTVNEAIFKFRNNADTAWNNVIRRLYLYSTTSIAETGTLPVTISPNPAGHELNIGLKESKPTAYSIMSLNGSIIASGSIDSKNSSIDIKAFATDIYFIQLRQEGKMSIGRFIKK